MCQSFYAFYQIKMKKYINMNVNREENRNNKIVSCNKNPGIKMEDAIENKINENSKFHYKKNQIFFCKRYI